MKKIVQIHFQEYISKQMILRLSINLSESIFKNLLNFLSLILLADRILQYL